MWVYTNKGMLSIVQHRDDPEILLVRSRERGTLVELFPSHKIVENKFADYPFRVFAIRDNLATTIADLVRGIDYPNFKDSVEDRNRHDTYMHIWQASHGLEAERYQVELERPEDWPERDE